MSESFEIGLSLAFNDGILESLEKARNDLAQFEDALGTNTVSVTQLMRVSQAARDLLKGDGLGQATASSPSAPNQEHGSIQSRDPTPTLEAAIDGQWVPPPVYPEVHLLSVGNMSSQRMADRTPGQASSALIDDEYVPSDLRQSTLLLDTPYPPIPHAAVSDMGGADFTDKLPPPPMPGLFPLSPSGVSSFYSNSHVSLAQSLMDTSIETTGSAAVAVPAPYDPIALGRRAFQPGIIETNASAPLYTKDQPAYDIVSPSLAVFQSGGAAGQSGDDAPMPRQHHVSAAMDSWDSPPPPPRSHVRPSMEPSAGENSERSLRVSDDSFSRHSPQGPMNGDVFLDGMLVGRWISKFLEREAGRATVGPTGFDTRRSRLLPGPTVGR